MAALVINSYPEELHEKLTKLASAHQRSMTQEPIHLIEKAIVAGEKQPTEASLPKVPYWAKRKLLPEYEAMIKSGAFSGGPDSTQIISEERDAR